MGLLASFSTDETIVEELRRMWTDPQTGHGPAKDAQRTQFNFLIGQRRLHGNPLQCSGLENPMDRGGWWATFHGVTESRTRMKRLGMTTHT